jgi:glutathione S-transferase
MSSRPTRFTLYSGPLSMFGAKAQIAALEKGLDFDLVMVAYESHLGYSPKHSEVLRVNPKGQVPVLVHGELEIFDSTQIFEYLEDLQPTPPLWPKDIVDRARAQIAWRISQMKCISLTSFATWECRRISAMLLPYQALQRLPPITLKWSGYWPAQSGLRATIHLRASPSAWRRFLGSVKVRP